MREILFRGKSMQGEWVEGYYWRDCTNGKHKITVSNMGDDNFRCYEVIPETVEINLFGEWIKLPDLENYKLVKK